MSGDLKARVEALERLMVRARSATESIEREIHGFWGRAREIEQEQIWRGDRIGGGPALDTTPVGNLVVEFVGCGGELLSGVEVTLLDDGSPIDTYTTGSDGRAYFDVPDGDLYSFQTTGPAGYADSDSDATVPAGIEVAGSYFGTFPIYGDASGADPYFCFGTACTGVKDGSALTLEFSLDGSTWNAMTWNSGTLRYTWTGGSPSRTWQTNAATTDIGLRITSVATGIYSYSVSSHDCGGNQITLATTASPLPVDLNSSVYLRLT